MLLLHASSAHALSSDAFLSPATLHGQQIWWWITFLQYKMLFDWPKSKTNKIWLFYALDLRSEKNGEKKLGSLKLNNDCNYNMSVISLLTSEGVTAQRFLLKQTTNNIESICNTWKCTRYPPLTLRGPPPHNLDINYVPPAKESGGGGASQQNVIEGNQTGRISTSRHSS